MDPVTPCSITLPFTTCSFTLLFECYFRLSSELGLSIAHPFVEHFKPLFFATNTDPFGLRIVEGCWRWQPIKRAICRVPILFGRGSKSFVLIRDSWQIISRSTRHLTCKRHIYKQDQASIILTLAGMICAICHFVFKHTCDLIQILCGWNAIWMNLDGTGYSNTVRIQLNCTIVVNVCFHSSWHLCMASKWQLFPAAKSFLVALAVGRRQCEYIMDGF